MLRVHRTPQETYVILPPHDTVLTLSHEYLQVSRNLAGCFLSRLRPVAKGLGNISTTLDPCWKGMLLLAVSNPSSRKIKMVISKVEDDKVVPVALTTMLLWYLAPMDKSEEGTLTFRLDNPAMRTDIWSELSAEPYRMFGSRHYQGFRELTQELSSYQPSFDHPGWAVQLKNQLDRLENAVEAQPRQLNIIRETLLSIHHLESDQMPQELLEKLNTLYGMEGTTVESSFEGYRAALDRTLARLADANPEQNKQFSTEYARRIYLAYQECNYQQLCSQVEEIHAIVRNKTQYAWRLDGFKRFWHTVVRPHLSGLLASAVLALILLWGRQMGSNEFFTNAAISTLPALASFILDHRST